MKALYQKYKNIILFAVIATLVISGYFIFFGGDNQSQTIVSETPQAQGESVVGRELLAQLLQLRSIDLDNQVFEDGAFRSLRDFSQELRQEPVGRRNPFAPF